MINYIVYGMIFTMEEKADISKHLQIGIDKISFYIPNIYLDLKTLAKARDVDYAKYKDGLLIEKMSIAPLYEDIITMAANASLHFLTPEDIAAIDTVLFTTESGLDYSKAAATHLISILGLHNNIRAIEMKQACYSTAAALYFAKGHILQNPEAKVLVLSADIAKYGLGAGGEPTQGAGATAMLISKNARILTLDNATSVYAEDVYDFWRPDGSDYAYVDGQYSNEIYQKIFLKTYNGYLAKTNKTLDDFAALTFHIPYAKLGLKTLRLIANEADNKSLFTNFAESVIYNKQIGNIYTGSLFLSLISLLENANLAVNAKIGIYAYGSGAVGEFFSGTLVDGYQEHLYKDIHRELLTNRTPLTISEYETLMTTKVQNDTELPTNHASNVQLVAIQNYKRIYKRKK